MVIIRKGSSCSCPICGKPCEGGKGFVASGYKLHRKYGTDTKGCKHYDGWEWDFKNKIMRHYFNKD